jgi:membrane fusion protein (multidrug efflux system)
LNLSSFDLRLTANREIRLLVSSGRLREKKPLGVMMGIQQLAAPFFQTSVEPRAQSRLAGSVTVFAALSLAILAGCSQKAAPAGPPPPTPVGVVHVTASDVPIRGEWVGTMDGYVNAQIQPQVGGYLIKQDYREGSQVAKGQVLFEIDPRPWQAAVDQAQGQLAQAQAQLGLAKVNVARDQPLADAHAIAHSQLDTELSQVQQAQAAVESAQANVASAKLNLGFTQVRSLISGIAGQATTQVGNLVNPQSALTSVSQVNPIKVYFSISDSEYLALTQKARSGGLLTAAARLPLTLVLSNGDVYPEKGHIVFVDRQMNAQTGAIRIAAAFPNPGSILRPGQFGRVQAETQVQHNVVLVPQVAVQELQGIEHVYTVDAGNKVHVVNVKLGAQYGKDWVVESGLPAGSTVVIDNLLKLGEGAPVNPHDAPPPDASNPPAGS